MSKAQELADGLFGKRRSDREGTVILTRNDMRALAEAAYRLGQHDGWDERDNYVESHVPTNPYGGDDEY